MIGCNIQYAVSFLTKNIIIPILGQIILYVSECRPTSSPMFHRDILFYMFQNVVQHRHQCFIGIYYFICFRMSSNRTLRAEEAYGWLVCFDAH